MTCSHCGSSNICKNGRISNVQRYKCIECKKSFLEVDTRNYPAFVSNIVAFIYKKGFTSKIISKKTTYKELAEIIDGSVDTVKIWCLPENNYDNGTKQFKRIEKTENGSARIIFRDFYVEIGPSPLGKEND